MTSGRPSHSPAVPFTARRSIALRMKRVVDVVGALVALIVLSPVFAWVALAILVTQGRPVMFRQERPGLHGQSFTILKFRSMRAARPDEVWYLTDEDRVTRLGRFLRGTSLDELPEFINVLRGDMSLVGPRPLFAHYLDHYTELEHTRHAMRPGITGWAVVNGRNSLHFRERLRLDLWYVEHWSLGLDLKILARTVKQVLDRTDVAITEDDELLGFPAPDSAVPPRELTVDPVPDSGPAVTTGSSDVRGTMRAMPSRILPNLGRTRPGTPPRRALRVDARPADDPTPDRRISGSRAVANPMLSRRHQNVLRDAAAPTEAADRMAASRTGVAQSAERLLPKHRVMQPPPSPHRDQLG